MFKKNTVASHSEKRLPVYMSPMKILIILVCAIFLVEIIVMFVLPLITSFSVTWSEAFIDATMLIILLSPTFYLLIFRPSILAITKHKQTEKKLNRRNYELSFLNQIIAISASGLELNEILEKTCHEISRTFDTPYSAAIMLNKEKTVSNIIAEYMAEGQIKIYTHISSVADNQAIQQLLIHKAPLLVDNKKNWFRMIPTHNLTNQHNSTSILLIPIIAEQEIVGCLVLDALKPREFSVRDINLVWSVADQIAGCFSHTRLTKNSQLLTTAIEQSAETIIITDIEGTIIYVNPIFEKVTGYSKSEIIGQNARILKSGKHNNAFYQNLWETISSGEVWSGRFINKRKNGLFYTEEATITPVRNESRTIINYVAVKRDITRELKLEEQYHQAQKMEAVGRLAGGIAHDFNNLLTTIMGYTSLAMGALPVDHQAREDLQSIQDASKHATDLTRQLLAFARKQKITPVIINLNDLILDVDKILRRLIGEDIELSTITFPELGLVKADPGQLEQVLFNLAVNARDAMPDGGKLTIETDNITLNENYADMHAEISAGEYVMLMVNDNGTGMSEEVKARIFEPFFTTKDIGKGTGLGLATCFGIIKQNNGHIWVYSELGQGTTFKIYLPRVKEYTNTATKKEQVKELPRGTETILLVEDEASVRNLTVRMLRQQGYTVLEAANGEKALQIVKSQPELKIHLLFTDMVMPLLGGKKLAEQLLKIRPNIKIIFSSGYTDNAVKNNGILEVGEDFLQKPFSMEMLARKVREILDS